MKTRLFLIALLFHFSVQSQPSFTLEDIFLNKRFTPNQLQGLSFLNQDQYLTQETSADGKSSTVVVHSLTDSTKKILLDTRILEGVVPGNDFTINSYSIIDSQQFIVSRNPKKIYRHSSRAEYYYINLPLKKAFPLLENTLQMYPAVAPDKKKVAFVVDNDLYVTDLKTGIATRLTTDGRYNYIINGSADWVYEEEFGLTSAFRWSPDSKQIAYLKFDETEVKEFSIDYYYNNYPVRESYKYPKAGEKNSVVSVWVVDVIKKKSVQVPVQAEYIPRIKWRATNELGILQLNRFQNELEINIYHVKEKTLSNIYKEVDKRYIDLPVCFEFMPDGELAISSEKSGFTHLYLLDRQGQALFSTKGSFEILAVKQINMTEKKAFLQIIGPSIERKSVVWWDFNSNTMQYVTDTTGTADIKMLGANTFMETYQSQDVRNRVRLCNLDTYTCRTLLLDQRAEDSILGKMTFFELELPGRSLSSWMILPPNFDSTKKYPVMFFVYGGPGEVKMSNAFPRPQKLWLHYLAQLGYIIVSVENRGSNGKGSEFKKQTYMKLGQLEVEDQIEAAEAIGQWSFVDATRIGIFGWSYGGYMSLLSLMQQKKPFKAAISVAPVTHWKFYDAVYTERYMRSPIANLPGYEKGSPLSLATKMEGELLLIHGTADDNVHFQNSLELMKVLNEAGKDYRLLVYPNKNHGIGGTNTSLHLYKAMTDFLLEKL